MILNPKKMIENGHLEPAKYTKVQQAGIDLTLKTAFRIERGLQLACDTYKHPTLKANRTRMEGHGGWYDFRPEGIYELDFNEVVKIPKNAIALVIQRSTLNRAGVSITGSIYDPGYHARVGATLRTHLPVSIQENARCAQIIFLEADSTSLYNGQYQKEGLKKEVK